MIPLPFFRKFFVLFVSAFLIGFFLSSTAALAQPKVSFNKQAGRLDVKIGNKIVASYVYEDSEIMRPYFCDVKTRDGVQVTRTHPPDARINKGNDDHPLFHPGLWLAFGDLGGSDFWRNKARVRHVEFAGPLVQEPGVGRFTVVNRYESADASGAVLCEENCSFAFHVLSSGYLMVMNSRFRSEAGEFFFGDQEEMGLGIRLNTPLTVKFGKGRITNDAGGENEQGTWGKVAAWCAALGADDGKGIAVSIMPSPDNFRPCWFHTRDYGLMVANPFGKKSMTAPDDRSVPPDTTTVKKGDCFALGFGVWVSDTAPESTPDFSSAYGEYLRVKDAPQ